MKFDQVKPALCTSVLDTIKNEFGFEFMTPVQSATLPMFLTNKDVSVHACTGSGKTLAFVIPMVEMIRKQLVSKNVSSSSLYCKILGMVLSPTRELARQIYENAVLFFKHVLPDVQVVLLVGGQDIDVDLDRFLATRGKFSVVIGTPGRIDDMLNRCVGVSVEMKGLEVLVLDEADTLLDMGFKATIDQILVRLPKQRRTGLFSATQTQEVKALARAGLRNPATICVKVSTKEQQTPMTLSNFYTYVPPNEKISHLVQFLNEKAEEKLIVFFSTCAAVDFYGRAIAALQTASAANYVSLHGRMTPKKRNVNYEEFSSKSTGVLFCTDIVARGIDLPDVDWIVQYDPPQDPSFFVHRVGRTARAGRNGCALTFLSASEDTYVNFLSIRKIPISEYTFQNEVSDVLPKMKELILQDRDLLEKGTKAFIAFIRSYKEHQCQFIFRFKDLDIGAVAQGFCLLQMPKMNEFRTRAINFVKDDTDISQIKFKDKQREKQRQKQYQELLAKRLREEAEAEMQSNKQKKAKEIAAAEENAKAPRRREKKRSKNQQIADEWDELAIEEMLFKKFKRGKISKLEYDSIMEGKDIEIPEEAVGVLPVELIKKQHKSRMKERFAPKEQHKQKTSQQKHDAKKREERIQLRKKKRTTGGKKH